MNDKNYWQHRFETDWEEAHGPEQSALHYQILIERLPEWLKREIKKYNYSLCDMGCGMGEGSQLLHENFPESNVIGVDFAQAAIEKANSNYKNHKVSFICDDIFDIDKNFDVIITSHTLEHFEDPFFIAKKLSTKCKYLIISVPFRENPLYEEHLFYFDYESFPLSLDSKQLLFYKEVEPTFFDAGNYFLKEQIIVVYGDNTHSRNFSLNELNNFNYDEKWEMRGKLDQELRLKNETISQLNQKLKIKNDELNHLNHEIDEFKNRKAIKWANKIKKL